MSQIQTSLTEYEIFLFINSGSGSGIGQQLGKLQGPLNLTIEVPSHYRNHVGFKKVNHSVTVHFFNMRTHRDEGFALTKKYLQEGRKCLGVICGGDGTVTWVISELHKNKISSDKIPFAVIPLGTGNDFSQSLGWGATTEDLLSNEYRKLKKFIAKMILSGEEYLDVWEVKAETFVYGKIQKWQNEHKNIGITITKPFVNYFSFGLDGKVGYSFDMHRTQSRLGNLTVYGALGLIKGVTKTKNLNQLLQNFRESKSSFENGKINFDQNDDVIFCPIEKGEKTLNKYQYNENILALNINSFMGGAKDIWKKSEPSGSMKNPQPQSSADGKLQFVSFSGSVSIGMEKSVGGFAHQVHQGYGPFYFSFKQYRKDEKHRTYLQIDGEFYRFNHPKQVVITKSPLLQGKFKVLRWKAPEKPKTTRCGCFG